MVPNLNFSLQAQRHVVFILQSSLIVLRNRISDNFMELNFSFNRLDISETSYGNNYCLVASNSFVRRDPNVFSKLYHTLRGEECYDLTIHKQIHLLLFSFNASPLIITKDPEILEPLERGKSCYLSLARNCSAKFRQF